MTYFLVGKRRPVRSMRHVEPRYTESLVGYKIAPYIRAMLLELKPWCRSKRNPENSEAHMADCKAGAGRHKGTAYVGDASKQASSQAGEQATQPLSSWRKAARGPTSLVRCWRTWQPAGDLRWRSLALAALRWRCQSRWKRQPLAELRWQCQSLPGETGGSRFHRDARSPLHAGCRGTCSPRARCSSCEFWHSLARRTSAR